MSKSSKGRPAPRGQRLSRRSFLRASALTVAAVASLQGVAARAQTKMSKRNAGYQDSPRGGQRCGGCRYFNSGNNTCQLVVGKISPQGWCRNYAAGTSGY